MSEEKTVSSIVLLEDCLGMVHNVRNNILKTRDRQYREMMAKKKQQARLLSRQRVVVERDEENMFEYETEQKHEDIMNKYSQAYKTQKNSDNESMDKINSGIEATTQDHASIRMKNKNEESMKGSNKPLELNPLEVQYSNINTSPTHLNNKKKNNDLKISPGGGHGVGVQGGSPLFKTTTKFVDVNDVNYQTDQKAVSLLNDFKNELYQWKEKNAIRMSEDSAREELSDYLIDKYMCQQLDLYTSSKVVTSVRKQIANSIELFASDGVLDPQVFDIATDNLLKEIDSRAVTTKNIAPEPTLINKKQNSSNVNDKEKSVHFDGQSIKQDIEKKKNEKMEKEKIKTAFIDYKQQKLTKQQYQQQQDDIKINSVESNIDSIKSLLNSINKK